MLSEGRVTWQASWKGKDAQKSLTAGASGGTRQQLLLVRRQLLLVLRDVPATRNPVEGWRKKIVK